MVTPPVVKIKLITKMELHYDSPEGFDGERVCKLFDKAWRRLPLRMRKAISAMVQDHTGMGLRLTNNDPLWNNSLISRGIPYHVYGGWCSHYCFMLLHKVYIDGMPDNVVESVILHELGHAYLYAVGKDEPYNEDLEHGKLYWMLYGMCVEHEIDRWTKTPSADACTAQDDQLQTEAKAEWEQSFKKKAEASATPAQAVAA